MSTFQATAIQKFNDTWAHYIAWAQAFGGAFTTFSWTAQTGHGEVANSGTGGSYAFTISSAAQVVPTTLLQPQVSYRFNGAWVSGTAYAGSNVINTASNCDLVTFTGQSVVTGNSNPGTWGNFTITGTNTVTMVFPTAVTAANGFVVGGTLVITGATGTNMAQLNGLTLTITSVGAGTGATVVATTGTVLTNQTATAPGTGTVATSGTSLSIQTFVKTTASSSPASSPGCNTTDFQPYVYEIWKTAGAQSTSHPIYIRIVYTTSAATNGQPAIHLGIGTGVDANGNLTGAIKTSSTNPTTNALIYSSTTGSATTTNLNFSGDSDNIRWGLWMGTSINSGLNEWILVVDRAKTATGGDSDAFAYVGWIYPLAGAIGNGNGILFKPSLSIPVNQGINGSNSGWVGATNNGNLTTSLSVFGSAPPFPIFPLVGYCANPLLGCIGLNQADASTDGQIFPIWLYGSSHNYLVCSLDGATAKYNLSGLTNQVVPAIRWE